MTLKLILTIKDGVDIIYRNDVDILAEDLNELIPELNEFLQDMKNIESC